MEKPQLLPCMALRRLIRESQVPLIDLRSPAEFILGSISEAVNLPLLSDAERHEIGTLYKREGSVTATQRGLELFAEKASQFTESLLRISERGSIAVHCWRGGMRSQSVGLYAANLGIKVHILTGGYKGYRSEVLKTLDHFAKHPLYVLIGRTGTGKTEFLRCLGEFAPIIDFEGIAHHRGSAFGDFSQSSPSPTQQNFENQLCDHYEVLRAKGPIVVEIEDFIGPCVIPLSLRNAIRNAPKILLERDFEDRVSRIVAEYGAGWGATTAQVFETRMALLNKKVNSNDSKAIVAAARDGRLGDAVRQLLRLRYDRAYDKSLSKFHQQTVLKLNLSKDFDGSLGRVLELLNSPTST